MRAADRHHRGRGGDQDPRQVPARPGERGVGPAARAHVRQDVPAHVRGLPRARRAAAGRGVPAALRAALDAGPDAVRGVSAAGARRRRRVAALGPVLVMGAGVVLLLAIFYALGRVRGRRRRRRAEPGAGDAAAGRPPSRASGTERSDARASEPEPARRGGCSCSSWPRRRSYVCLDRRARRARSSTRRRSPRARDAGRSGRRRFRTSFGNASVRMRVDGRVPTSPRARPDRLPISRGRARGGCRTPRGRTARHDARAPASSSPAPRCCRGSSATRTGRGWRSGCGSAGSSWRRRSWSATGRPTCVAALRYLAAWRGSGHHERRPRPDRGRPHRRRWSPSSRASAGARLWRWRSGSARSASGCGRAGADLDRGGAARGRPASRRSCPAGADGARAGRHGARPGRAGGSAGPLVVVLPGPPRELQPMWARRSEPRARAAVRWRGSLDAADPADVRDAGVRDRADAARAGSTSSGLEITTCLRRGEIEIATVFRPADASRVRGVRGARARTARPTRCSPATARRSTSIVAGLLLGPPGRTIAVAESCTGGLMAARLTERAGSSAYVARRHRRLLELGEGRRWSASPEALIARARRGVAGGGSGAGRGAPRAVRRGPRHRHHRGRRSRRRDARPSRSGPSASASRAAGGALAERTVHLPGDRADRPRAHHDRRDALSATAARRLAARRAVSAPAAVRRARAAAGRPGRARRLPRRAPTRRSGARSRTRALHLTLVFLGNRPDGDETTVSGVLHSARRGGRARARARPRRRPAPLAAPPARPLRVTLATRRARSRALQSAVSAGLEAAGLFEPEQRRFRAARHGRPPAPRSAAPRGRSTPPRCRSRSPAAPLTLFASRLHPHGARYEPLTRVSARLIRRAFRHICALSRAAHRPRLSFCPTRNPCCEPNVTRSQETT